MQKEEGFRSIWLGSWKENSRANAFYAKMQFDIVGTTSFVLGSEIQEDFVFKKIASLTDKNVDALFIWLAGTDLPKRSCFQRLRSMVVLGCADVYKNC
jgi:ribosomal protein S18 acetylase RimI-like enzyme